jgi:cytochrome c556
MIRKLLVVFAILMLGVTAAAAQSCQDIVAKRQALMKKSAAVGKDGAAMIRGDTPFDLAKAQAILATFAEDATALPSLFPDCSKAAEHTTAAPAIWDKPDDFKAAMAKFAADVKAAQDATKDLDSFKTNFQIIGKNCGSCHQSFRVGKS